MRVSRLLLVTLRDVPAEAEIPSHQLLVRGGYIRRIAGGIYAYMPLMWRVIKKIIKIVREEMDSNSSLETLLPQLHPSELWEKTGRWQSYTQGEGLMFNLKDRQGRKLGLGPTHEEIATTIAKETINSYKQLPISIYQIQTKFRDEIRPRFGLMRSREFIMKDAYSFHSNQKDLKLEYEKMNKAYNKIFKRCGIKTVAVDADSGSIGGGSSQEFMVTAKSGEDLILISEDLTYAANQEKAVSIPKKPKILNVKEETIIETPYQESLEELCSAQNLHPSQVVKVILLIAIIETNKIIPIIASIRGDQSLNEVKLNNIITNKLDSKVIELKVITKKDLREENLNNWPLGSIGPNFEDSHLNGSKSWEPTFLRLVDHTAAELNCFVCGANQIGKHLKGVSWKSIGGIINESDFRTAREGEACIHNQNQRLEEIRGIEVGHIFQLGEKYSKALDAYFTNESGQMQTFSMGCYGIGISRLAQAAIEQNHDENGICWPVAISPFEAVVVIANIKDPIQATLGEEIYNTLLQKGVDALIDDRDERAGVKFKDSELIGIPWRIVVGRDAQSKQVEVIERATKDTELLNYEEAIKKLLKEIIVK